MTSRIGLSAAFVAIAAAVLLGQQSAPGSLPPGLPSGPSPRQPRPSPPVFRAGVEAVEMDVFVTDKDGNPVSGLTVDDFEVVEDDKPQVITTFAPVSMPIERREPLPFGAESDVQTNNREHRHVYLMLLGGMEAENALKTRYRIRQFLTEYFGDNDMAAIFALSASSTQDGQDFTGNRRLLIEAIDKFTGAQGAGGREGSRILAQDFWQHMELLARIPGERKSVLLFGSAASAGVTDIYDIIDYQGGVQGLATEYAHAAIAAASRANIPIYPINPGGEVNFDPDSRALARLTGGFAHIGGNDFTATFDRLVSETSTFYVLGFNSTLHRNEGRHIKLEAIVKRPGLTVRTRSGYVDQLEYIRTRRTPPEPKRTPVETALASPLATAGLPVRVFAAPYKRWDRFSTVALAIELDAASLGFTERDGLFAADFEVRHLATDVTAKIHPEFRHRGTLSLDGPTHARVTASGVRVVAQFDLPAGRYQVRVASARGATKGGVVYDLVVPDFRRGPLAMSGVALTSLSAADVFTLRPDKYRKSDKGATTCRERVCRAGTTFDDLLTTYESTRGGDTPLLRDVLPAPPTATRDFAPTDTLALYTEVYDNDKRGRKDPPLTIGLTATLHDAAGTQVRQVSDQRSADDKRRPSDGHGFTLRLPLEGVASGSYVLRVEASSSREETPAVSRSIPIRVM